MSSFAKKKVARVKDLSPLKSTLDALTATLLDLSLWLIRNISWEVTTQRFLSTPAFCVVWKGCMIQTCAGC